jgi:hypothetical protein
MKDNNIQTSFDKSFSRRQYASRQIDKFIKASFNTKGYLKFKELVEVQDHYNIKVYG